MQDLMLRFPHLPEQIFQKLDSESLSKSREVARYWQNIIDGKNYPWLHLVNIPTILNKKDSYLHLAAKSGQIKAFETALNEKSGKKNTKNKLGKTPFHLACDKGHSNVVKILMKNPSALSIDFNVVFSLICVYYHTHPTFLTIFHIKIYK